MGSCTGTSSGIPVTLHVANDAPCFLSSESISFVCSFIVAISLFCSLMIVNRCELGKLLFSSKNKNH